jgi:hypothetical protein
LPVSLSVGEKINLSVQRTRKKKCNSNAAVQTTVGLQLSLASPGRAGNSRGGHARNGDGMSPHKHNNSTMQCLVMHVRKQGHVLM